MSDDEQTRLRAEMRERALRNEISELNAAERKGKREGRLEGMIEMIIGNLEFRFHNVPESIKKRLASFAELEKLKAIQRNTLSTNSLQEFEKMLDSI